MRAKLPVFVLLNVMIQANAFAGEFEAGLVLDRVENLQGGIEETGETLANVDLTYELKTSEIGGPENGTFFAYILGNDGGDPSENVGDAQVTSNIETNDTVKVYELWYQHALSENNAITVGLHDYNSVFYGLDSSGLLINSSFGIGPEVAQVGPSIFSTTSVGVIFTSDRDNQYTYAAVYDGVPGDPDDDKGTHIKFDSGDGLFTAIEHGWLGGEDNPWKIGVGAWHHSAEVASPVDGAEVDSNFGIYSIGEKTFADKLSGFYQLGFASESKNAVSKYLGMGVTKEEFLSSKGSISAGIAIAMLGGDFKDENPGTESQEIAIELTYAYTYNDYLTIHPDVQYIVKPGFSEDLDNALVLTLRLESAISF